MTAGPEVVALLADFDVERGGARQRFVHRDGRPFTAEETELIGSTTDDMRAAASQLAVARYRLTELVAPASWREICRGQLKICPILAQRGRPQPV